MEEAATYQQVKKKGLNSVFSLFFQSGYSAVLGLGANLAVTILLSPSIFGMYITVLSVISLLNYFSDLGLAASLVQKKEVSNDDIRTTFTTQQFLVLTITVIGYFSTQFVQSFYKLPQAGVYLYWSLLLGFVISSLKTIPSILLERKIQFQKIVLVQIIENTVFYSVVVVCALLKMELMSFTIAVLSRAVVGLVVIYTVSPWIPKVGISPKSLRSLLSFGIPFQASSFLALFKDDLIMLFLGKAVGFTGVGYIGWAKKWAESPIRIIMDNITKVLFPVISRLQSDTKKIGQLIEKILYYQTLVLVPIFVGMASLMSNVVQIIPRYSKWEPALPLFYLFCISALLASFSSPLINLINALGKAKVPFIFMLIWTIATWILTPILTFYLSYYGFPLTIVVISFSSVAVALVAKRYVPFSIIKPCSKPFMSGLIMGATLLITKQFVPTTLVYSAFLGLAGVGVYIASLKVLYGISLVNELGGLVRPHKDL